MAIDLEGIRKRIAELNGQRGFSNIQLWKPAVGDYKVRVIPWKATPDGMPFRELKFYYLGETPRFLAPHQFGKPDPVNDLAKKLFSTKDPNDRELAKKLMPKMVTYAPIIVRGEESKNVQVWSFNRFVYARLLSFFTDTETNPDLTDYMDPLEGIDLRVNVKPSGKKFNGKDVFDTTIDLGRRQTKLHDDPEVAKKWLDGVPNLDSMFPLKTKEEVEKLLNAYLSGGETTDEGTQRGGQQVTVPDELDRIASEVKSSKDAPSRSRKRSPSRRSLSRRRRPTSTSTNSRSSPRSSRSTMRSTS